MLLQGCSQHLRPSAATPASLVNSHAPQFDSRVVEIATQYKQYTLVSDTTNWAPSDCRAPIPGGVVASASDHKATHGGKLYNLYAAKPTEYRATANGTASPVGQVVVKESFAAILVPTDEVPRKDARGIGIPLPHNYATRDGQLYRQGEPGALFIMFKLDPSTPDTDNGWVYATTTPDGKEVTSAGVVFSCVGCHKETTRDRLYGPRWSWPRLADGRRVPPTQDAAQELRQQSTTASNPP